MPAMPARSPAVGAERSVPFLEQNRRSGRDHHRAALVRTQPRSQMERVLGSVFTQSPEAPPTCSVPRLSPDTGRSNAQYRPESGRTGLASHATGPTGRRAPGGVPTTPNQGAPRNWSPRVRLPAARPRARRGEGSNHAAPGARRHYSASGSSRLPTTSTVTVATGPEMPASARRDCGAHGSGAAAFPVHAALPQRLPPGACLTLNVYKYCRPPPRDVVDHNDLIGIEPVPSASQTSVRRPPS
jgi:hypothetical protein